MDIDYKKIEFALHESLVQIDNAYRLLEFDEGLLKKVQECKDLVRTKRYAVAVMGEFKRGKSTLINALLGLKILPADATPTTATINRITFAPTPKAVITYRDGFEETIEIDRLGEYVSKRTSDGEERALTIREVTVYYPTQLCQNHVDLIDTPGLNDEARMTEITIDMIENVDAIIVPIHARAPFSATEKDFVCRLLEHSNIQNIVFVVTFMDQLDEDDFEPESFMNHVSQRIRTEVFEELERRDTNDRIIKKAHAILDDMNLFAVSSSLALKSFVTNNRSDLKKSGFEEFSRGLLRIVTAKQIENAVIKSINQIRLLLSSMAHQNEKRLASLNSEIGKAKEVFDVVSAYSDDVKVFLDRLFSGSCTSIEGIVNRLHTFKNKAVSIFVKSLSEIKTDTHSEIESTLKDAAILCRHMFNEDGLPPIRQEINGIMAEDMQTLLNYKQSTLIPALEYFGILESDNSATDMLNYAKDGLGGVSFEWSYSIIPPAIDLVDHNVIEIVVEAIDHSVRDSVNRLNGSLTEARKYWFGKANDDAMKNTSLADTAYHARCEKLNLKINAQLHNYSVLEADAKAIEEKCDQLLNSCSEPQI